MTDNTKPDYPALPAYIYGRECAANERVFTADQMRAYVDADRAGWAGDAEPDNPLVLIRELLAHIDDVLSDAEFEKIDTAKWNAVSALTAILPQAPERGQEPTDAMLLAACRALNPVLFARGLQAPEFFGPNTRRWLNEEKETAHRMLSAALAASREGGAK